MSAIWGAIAFDNNVILNSNKNALLEAYKGLKIDRFEQISRPNIYLGCGIQYFNYEATKEILPYCDDEVYFTGDIVLDNRNELCQKYNLDTSLPDGSIFIMLYKKYGNDILNELVGAYAAAIYYIKKNELILLNDAVGERCVYYTRYENTVYFSTLYEPLAKITNAEFNDNWFVDFLSMDHMIINSDSISTPYNNIYRVAPAHCTAFTPMATDDFRYWKPLDNLVQCKASDKTVKNKFISLCETVTRDMLRTTGNVSIQLSGGLDSTTVAHFLCKELEKSGKSLYSYTFVPLASYKTDSSTCVDNEKADVLQTVDFYKNIIPSFIDIEGVNPWNTHKQQLDCFEAPYKSVQNVLWITKCCELAYSNNSRLMFTGAFGNTSISYSSSKSCFEYMYMHHRYFSFFKELFALSNYTHSSRKNMFKIIRQNCKAYKKHNINLKNTDYSTSFVNSNAFAATGCKERLDNLYQSLNGANDYNTGLAAYIMNELPFRQMGDAATKRSLTTGVLQRDPTKDKRIIEFCISLKPTQFYKNGIDRRLVCEYLKELLPPHIIENTRFKRGRQSADITYRFSLDWNDIRNQWMNLYKENFNNPYVDCKKAYYDLKEKPDISSYNRFELTRHTYTAMVVEFTKS